MKIIAYNSTLNFRTFGVPTHWDYDALGTFFSGQDAWNNNPDSRPIYFFQSSEDGFTLRYKVNAETPNSIVALNNGNIIRMFGGDVFLQYSDSLFVEITNLTKEPINVVSKQYYEYNSETNRINTTPIKTNETHWNSAAINVNAGDIVVYNGAGGMVPRLIGFQNEQTCYVVDQSLSTKGYYYYYKAPSSGVVYYNNCNHPYGVYVLRQP